MRSSTTLTQRGREERERQRREERPAAAVHQRDGDVAAEHREAQCARLTKFIIPSVTDSPTDSRNSSIP